MRLCRALGLSLCGILLFSGCRAQQSAAAPRSDAAEAPVLAGQGGGAGAVSPIDNYRAARMAEAMRGLRYESGLVQIDETAAAAIVDHRSADEAQAEAGRGRGLLDQGEFVDAVAAHTRAVLLAPDQPDLYDDLGVALTFKGRIAEAAAAYRTALALDPERVDSRARLAGALQMLNDFDAAIGAWEQVLEARPDDVEANTRIAILLYYQGDFPAAWQHVHAAEKAGGNVPPQFRPLLAERMAEPQ